MLRPFELHRPATVAEAAALLADRPDAVLYAGGTELLLLMKAGLLRPADLIDVKRISRSRPTGATCSPSRASLISCETQDEGAVVQGLGHTLYEEMVYDGGQLLNGTLLDYRVPRAADVPRLGCLFVENADGPGPFGAKGAGEGSLVPVSPAVGNALARLTGIRFRELPLTPERVWRALRQRESRRTS